MAYPLQIFFTATREKALDFWIGLLLGTAIGFQGNAKNGAWLFSLKPSAKQHHVQCHHHRIGQTHQMPIHGHQLNLMVSLAWACSSTDGNAAVSALAYAARAVRSTAALVAVLGVA
jgi:hypothetical protein